MRILITRPREDAAALAEDLSARGHETLIEPLMTVVPRDDAEVDLEGVQALAFTSANGARVFAALSDRRDLPVFAVGDSTAAAARAAGFDRVESAGGDVTALAALISERLGPAAGIVFHGAARTVAGDLKGQLEEAGFAVRRVALYDAQPAGQLSPGAEQALRDGTVDAVLFFSPRTADTFVRLASTARLAAACGACLAVCLSQAVAERVSALSWRAVHVAAQPTRAALLDCLAAIETPAA